MAEAVKKEEEKKEEKKKGPLGKLKEFSEDKEEQMEIFSTFVRLGILIWSGGILTLNYVSIPNFPHKNILTRGRHIPKKSRFPVTLGYTKK